MKFTVSEKLKYVKMHLEENVPIMEIVKVHGFDRGRLNYCCNLYKMYGEKAFEKEEKARTYTREEKLKAIVEVLSEGKTLREVALAMMLSDPTIVSDWVKKYQKEGEAAIKDTYSRAAYLKHDERVLEKEYRKLLEDLERTKAENEYLKKSFPHILKRSKQPKKK